MRPTNKKQGQISKLWPLKCQYGNPAHKRFCFKQDVIFKTFGAG